MTPARRRQATPASKGPTTTAPDVPVVANAPSVPAKEGAKLLGPDGAPAKQDAPTRDAGGNSALPTKTGKVVPEDPTKQSPRRSRGRYPLPVWPD
jgi:hypothetical protein